MKNHRASFLLSVWDKSYLSKGKVLLDVEEASVVGLQFDLQEVFWCVLIVNKQRSRAGIDTQYLAFHRNNFKPVFTHCTELTELNKLDEIITAAVVILI